MDADGYLLLNMYSIIQYSNIVVYTQASPYRSTGVHDGIVHMSLVVKG